MINKRDSKIHHHVRLSLFVMAELIDTLPNPQQYNAAPRLALTGGWMSAWAMGVASVLAGKLLSDPGLGLVTLRVLVEGSAGVVRLVRRPKATLLGAPCIAS